MSAWTTARRSVKAIDRRSHTPGPSRKWRSTSRLRASAHAITRGSGSRSARPPWPSNDQCMAPLLALSIFAIAWSIVKLPAFWRGGNSLNVLRKSPTISDADTLAQDGIRPFRDRIAARREVEILRDEARPRFHDQLALPGPAEPPPC